MNTQKIIKDRSSGSSSLCEDTCALLSSMPPEEGRDAAQRILEAHRPMALLHRCIERYLAGEDVSDFMTGYRERMKRAAEHAKEHLKGMKRVITLSSSSVVEEALSGFDGEIYVMESRPMMEGTAMAERLAEKGRNVTVVTDAYGISMAARGEVDAVIVGADAIYKGMLVNKVGTYALSAAAEKSGIEFMAVLTTDKVFPEAIELSEEEIMQFHDPKEITERVNAINPYFEGVEIKKGVRMIMENGVLGED